MTRPKTDSSFSRSCCASLKAGTERFNSLAILSGLAIFIFKIPLCLWQQKLPGGRAEPDSSMAAGQQSHASVTSFR